MHIAYADEYGDAGYKIDSGSSALFIMTIILPRDPESLLNSIASARRQLGKPETFEFHYRSANAEFRRAFFEAIAKERMEHYVSIIYKEHAVSELKKKGKVGLYTYALAGLALRAPMPLQNVKLYLDGTGKQKEFVRALKNGVRQICNAAGRPGQNFQEIRILNSTHPLIQCADMFTGAAAEHVRQGNSRWLDRLQIDRRVWWEEKFDGKTKPL